jgi:hypothetical protein
MAIRQRRQVFKPSPRLLTRAKRQTAPSGFIDKQRRCDINLAGETHMKSV